MNQAILAIGALALAACGDGGNTAGDAGLNSARSSYDALQGVWAAAGSCGDYTAEWVIDAESINLHEMHCSAERVEKSAKGVRTSGDCSVEGHDDGVPDTYELVLEADGSLTIIQESNGAAYRGLTRCAPAQ